MTFTVREVCERYGVSEATVRKWSESGELVGFSVSRSPGSKKKRLRYTEQALAQFESRRTPTSTVPLTRQRKRRQPEVIQFYK